MTKMTSRRKKQEEIKENPLNENTEESKETTDTEISRENKDQIDPKKIYEEPAEKPKKTHKKIFERSYISGNLIFLSFFNNFQTKS